MSTVQINTGYIMSNTSNAYSKQDALVYKIDQLQQNLMSLTNSLSSGRFYGLENNINNFIGQVLSLGNLIDTNMTLLQSKVNSLDSIIKGLDDIAKDPVMNRTIDDLKRIADMTDR
jgi:replicative DNA helicase